MLTIGDIQHNVAQIAPLYEIKKVSLFGSYAKGTQTEGSDIDLLVEFKSRPISIYRIAGVKLKMEELTGKEVDVIVSPVPPNALIEIDKEVLIYG